MQQGVQGDAAPLPGRVFYRAAQEAIPTWGVQGDAVPLPGRGVSPLPLSFIYLPQQAAQGGHLNNYGRKR